MINLSNQIINIDHIIILLIGIIIGSAISHFRKKRKYYLRKKELLQIINDREEWIKILEQKIQILGSGDENKLLSKK